MGKKFKISKLFKDDDGRFLLLTGVKFMSVFLLASINLYYIFWNIISLNNVFFESKEFGLSHDLRSDFLIKSLEVFGDHLISVFVFFIFLFFGGMYIGKVLLRPFELIGQYCLARTEGENVEYNPDLFSDYKLLSRFSEYFFTYLKDVEKTKTLRKNSVPGIYLKIHSPPFEKVFFFHFFIIVLILAGISVLFVNFVISEMQGSILKVAMTLVKTTDKSVAYFLTNQEFIFNGVLIYISMIVFVGYVLVCFHLYSKISGPIFAFFSTMRSFSKGNYKARVHLLGYAHIRPHGRAFNKYLDHVERECNKSHNEVQS